MLSSEEKLFRKIVKAQAKKQKIQASGKRQMEPNLLGISDTLDGYYFFCKLKNYCAYLDYRLLVKAETIKYQQSDFKLMDAIIEEVEQQSFENAPLLYIYNQIRRLLVASSDEKSQETTDFDKLFANVNQIALKLPSDEAVEIYSYLSNYCIRQQNKGNKAFIVRLFQVYNEMLNLKAHKKRPKIPINHGIFKNMVMSALYLKNTALFETFKTFGLQPNDSTGFKDAFEWIQKFIDVYQYKIEKKNRPVYVNYCRGILAFEQKDFKKALSFVQESHHIQDMFINFDNKILYLKVLFEIFIQKNKQEIDLTIQKIWESYRGLLKDEQKKKKRLEPKHYDYYETFHKYYDRLYKLSPYRDAPDFEPVFRAELQALRYPFKAWFLEKLEALDHRRKK